MILLTRDFSYQSVYLHCCFILVNVIFPSAKAGIELKTSGYKRDDCLKVLFLVNMEDVKLSSWMK